MLLIQVGTFVLLYPIIKLYVTVRMLVRLTQSLILNLSATWLPVVSAAGTSRSDLDPVIAD